MQHMVYYRKRYLIFPVQYNAVQYKFIHSAQGRGRIGGAVEINVPRIGYDRFPSSSSLHLFRSILTSLLHIGHSFIFV